jgi:hypothetical protein
MNRSDLISTFASDLKVSAHEASPIIDTILTTNKQPTPEGPVSGFETDTLVQKQGDNGSTKKKLPTRRNI